MKADYQPDLPQADVEFLGIEHPESRTASELKLKRSDHRANASEYSVEHPLPISEVNA